MKTVSIIAIIIFSIHLSPIQGQAVEPFSGQNPSEQLLNQDNKDRTAESSKSTTIRSRPVDPADPGEVPVGEGILIMSALALGYAAFRRK